MPDRPIVLTGASGVLGASFARALPVGGLVCLGRDTLDPAAPDRVIRHIVSLEPDLVINCAADTDVEGAEAAPERAFAVNADLAGALAQGAAEIGARMVHVSSTGCYGEGKTTPYTEADPLQPTTVHHRSKALGEEKVLAACPAALVLRVGWLFGGAPGQRKNFVWARLMEARGRSEIGSDPAQRGCPTAATDIVAQSLALLEADASGVFNAVGAGDPATRLDYVASILQAAGSPTKVVPVAFTRRAPVSANEAATNARLKHMGLMRMSPWRDSLAAFVRGLVEAGVDV